MVDMKQTLEHYDEGFDLRIKLREGITEPNIAWIAKTDKDIFSFMETFFPAGYNSIIVGNTIGVFNPKTDETYGSFFFNDKTNTLYLYLELRATGLSYTELRHSKDSLMRLVQRVGGIWTEDIILMGVEV